ncbi:DUF5958 family protein [Microbispora bryophytorum]|uniref:Uncharacterized protein n=1 Tax=Microbispora bryophytorum TaxID=1460882 RepID=A0A8H9LGC7_9ACTN|nr:DUF5958 family protein [Microbispora bryophytorum]MBD3140298.1 hypothetical protein [Microbispora bryophytorum]TQS02016.1 hypothetical protein FLX07_30135 [Microbispora bryophytorum]GGO26598.1 hypothetical protein GCM10011574_59230 [Microbispora bryophytorum]
MREYAAVLNELAQALRPMSWGVTWFEELASEDQFAVLRDLAGYSTQRNVARDIALRGVTGWAVSHAADDPA